MTDLRHLLPPEIITPTQVEIGGVALRAQDVEKGDLCILAPSHQGKDISDFIRLAEKRAAGAIVIPSHISYTSSNTIIITVDNPRYVISYVAARLYPQQPQNIVAVTGTNGKSSVVNFVNQMWAYSGIIGASLGTLGLNINSTEDYLNPDLTTPNAIDLHQILDRLYKENIQHLAFEASSHGLDQNRLDHVHIKAAAFTNLSQDHLDYHKTFENYFAAKCLLFEKILPQEGVAILNADTEQFQALKEICQKRSVQSILDYGRKAEAIKILNITAQNNSQDCLLRVFHKTYNLRFPLVGEFQVYNALCALGMVVGSGVNLEKALASLEYLKPIPGRLEYIGTSKAGGRIFVDYAHTPDALATILNMLRAHCRHKLHVVFGCGGNRDSSKRSIMGNIANRSADFVYITDDNPRFENPSEIRRQILAHSPKAKEVADRYEAIETAIKNMEDGDVLLIAGKGHETYQIYGDVRYDFDDREVAREIIEKGY